MEKHIDNVAFIIPAHPPYYHYVYKLVNTIKEIIDIYIIFSNNNDYAQFIMKDQIKAIMLDENVNTKSIITYKKFHGLKTLKNNLKYEYFIVCDSQSNIIVDNFTKENVTKKIEAIFNNKIIYGCEINTTYPNYELSMKITRQTTEIFKERKDELKSLTNDYHLYYWWSDLPVYKRDHLDDFFSKIDYSNIDYFHFDHMIYQNYLMLYHNFTILNMVPLLSLPLIKKKKVNASLEYFITDDENDLHVLKQNGYGFSWVFPVLFNKYRDFLINEGTFLLYHLNMEGVSLFVL
jgi:hypothetical protein